MKNREYIKAAENLRRDEEKAWQRKDKRAQVENLTLMREKKKPKTTGRKKSPPKSSAVPAPPRSE